MSPEERLAAIGFSLPEVVEPVAEYVPAVRSGRHVFLSGQVPWRKGRLMATGKLGATVSVELGYDCARQCALNALAALRAEVGDLSVVTRIVKVLAFISSTSEFTRQPEVADGASELLRQVFGTAGEHARSAVSVPALPLDAPVELELVVEVA